MKYHVRLEIPFISSANVTVEIEASSREEAYSKATEQDENGNSLVQAILDDGEYGLPILPWKDMTMLVEEDYRKIYGNNLDLGKGRYVKWGGTICWHSVDEIGT